MSQVTQQGSGVARRSIVSVGMLAVGVILLLNAVPALLSSVGTLVSWIPIVGLDRALEANLVFVLLPFFLSVVGLILVRFGWTRVRRAGAEARALAQQQWQQRAPQVQQAMQQRGLTQGQLAERARSFEQQARQRAAEQQARIQQQARPQQHGGPQQQPRLQQAAPQQMQPPRPAGRPMQHAVAGQHPQTLRELGNDPRARDALRRMQQELAAAGQRAITPQVAAAPPPPDPDDLLSLPGVKPSPRGSSNRHASVLTRSSLRSSALGSTSLRLDSLRVRR